jgi:NTP pyrophosphatase (non-canonical NTP hydrolase)
MQLEVRAWCERKGWRGEGAPGKTFGDDMALLHSEVSEALEAFRQWGTADATEVRPEDHLNWCAAHGHTGPCPSVDCPVPKPEGVGSEFADVLIRLLDDCAEHGVDLVFEYERKMAYNERRPHRHGGKLL